MMLDDTWTRLVRYAFVQEWLGDRDVLEVGCGNGTGAALLADRSRHVVSGDVSGDVVARARLRTTRPNLEFRAIDPLAIDLPDASFDVVSVPAAEAWIRDARFLAEIRRVLRPGGLLYIAVASADRPGVASGLGYHDFVALLGRAFPTVRAIAQVPGVHFTLTEFAPEGEPDPCLDGSLLDDPEPCSHYVALCGDGEVPHPGYGVLVVPKLALAEGDATDRAVETVRLEARAAQAEARAELLDGELRDQRSQSRGAAERSGGDAQPADLRADLEAAQKAARAAEERLAALEAQRQAESWQVEEANEQAAARAREIEALRDGAGLHEREAQRLQSEIDDLRAFAEEWEDERRELEAERARLLAQLARSASRHDELAGEVSRRGMRIAELEGLLKGRELRGETEPS